VNPLLLTATPFIAPAEKSALAPSPASADAWLRELERAGSQPKQTAGPARDPRANSGSESDGKAAARIPARMAAPMDGREAAPMRSGAREQQAAFAGDRAAPRAIAGAVAAEQEGSPALGDALLRRVLLPMDGTPGLRASTFAQLLARQAWARRKVTVAGDETGVSISMRDADLDGVGDAKLLDFLETECARAGHQLSALTVNGRHLKYSPVAADHVGPDETTERRST